MYIFRLLVIVVVYFVGGVLFMKFKREASGKDLIPNVEFWSSIPGLVKDGIKFSYNHTIGKCSSRSGYSSM